ncbi:MAG: YegS/Rv2252/BmrU family lipid kinase [Rhodospirillaceae bacterium]|nr:YegS/Rv2252/BmrU family lipid kinase [Rhodospirillaceae bacterium]
MTGSLQIDVASRAVAPSRIAIIFNPIAGSRRRRRRLAAAIRVLRRLGCRIALHRTTAHGDAALLAAAIARDGRTDTLMIAGGDGTIADAAHGLATCAADKLPALAILPLGTANVLAREIGLPRDPEAQAAIAAAGPMMTVALAQANGRHFLLMAGAGFDAHVVAGIDVAFKRRVGKIAYVFEMLRQLGRFPFGTYRVAIDGEPHFVASVVVTRGRLYGGSFVLAPDARLDEAALHVCCFEHGGRFWAVLYAMALGIGLLPRMPGFTIRRAQRVRIEGVPGEPLQADGDTIGSLPVEIAMTDKSLGLVVP